VAHKSRPLDSISLDTGTAVPFTENVLGEPCPHNGNDPSLQLIGIRGTTIFRFATWVILGLEILLQIPLLRLFLLRSFIYRMDFKIGFNSIDTMGRRR
jgi:hypothetical protein